MMNMERTCKQLLQITKSKSMTLRLSTGSAMFDGKMIFFAIIGKTNFLLFILKVI